MRSLLPTSPIPQAGTAWGQEGFPLSQISPIGEKETRRTSTAFTTEGPKSSHHHQGHLQLSLPRTSADRAAHSLCHCVLPKQELLLIPLRARHTTPFPFSSYFPQVLVPQRGYPCPQTLVLLLPCTYLCSWPWHQGGSPQAWLVHRVGWGGEETRKIPVATTEHLQYNWS